MRKARRATVTLLAVAAMVVGLTVAPVAADEPAPLAGAIVFHGTANVSPGLQIPDPLDLTKPSGTWRFEAPVRPFPDDFCIDLDSNGVAEANCSIDAAGELFPALGISGPSCGNSNGANGEGQYTSSSGLTYTLRDVGWLTSAGGTLPITGTIEHDGDEGILVGVVQAQGGADCLGDGASEFVVLGVAAAVMNP